VSKGFENGECVKTLRALNAVIDNRNLQQMARHHFKISSCRQAIDRVCGYSNRSIFADFRYLNELFEKQYFTARKMDYSLLQ